MKINIDKGKKAFRGCPCCGAEVSEYGPPDEEYYPYWGFTCGSEIILGPSGLEVFDVCPKATEVVVKGLTVG